MNKCGLCGRNVSDKNAHFGSTCMKNVCTIIGMGNRKKSISETILNNKIAKLANKKKLSKENKTILTNKYLTLQLLNNVPIKGYDTMRRTIEKDIERVGTNKRMSKEETTMTLKQAYEVYKLYNKFQKIKSKSEEVDNEYIQNFLFDNLRFAFSVYYNNKKYLGGLLADIQYFLWKLVIVWKKKQYPSGTEFINHSLKKNPEDKMITDGKIIEDIKADSKFIEKINGILKLNTNNTEINITEGLNYANPDLFLALNNTTINVRGNKENGKWKLDIKITDRYDFTDFKEIDEYCDDNIIKGLVGSAANNAAMVSIASGVMHEYNVTIKFTIDEWSVDNE